MNRIVPLSFINSNITCFSASISLKLTINHTLSALNRMSKYKETNRFTVQLLAQGNQVHLKLIFEWRSKTGKHEILHLDALLKWLCE